MTEPKRLFRRVFDSLLEGSRRQAQRHVTEYPRMRPGRADELRD